MRVFIRGFPVGTSEEDIRALVQRVAPLEEVYFPGPTLTGVFRNFAVVRLIESQNNIAEICVKKLNSCIWKGVKIQVELASNAFYEDRLQEERRSAREEREVPQLNVKVSITQIDPSHILHLRRVRGGELISVHQQPIAKSSKNANNNCGIKTVFDENYAPVIMLSPARDGDVNKIEQKSEVSRQIVIVPGKRLGFGTLLIDGERYPENYMEPIKPYITHAPAIGI